MIILKASFTSGSSWNKVLHDGVLCWSCQSVLNGTADFGAASSLANSKIGAGISYCIPKLEWVMDNKLIILGYKSFLILSQEYPGITI
jgi:hypothetical protein